MSLKFFKSNLAARINTCRVLSMFLASQNPQYAYSITSLRTPDSKPKANSSLNLIVTKPLESSVNV